MCTRDEDELFQLKPFSWGGLRTVLIFLEQARELSRPLGDRFKASRPPPFLTLLFVEQRCL